MFNSSNFLFIFKIHRNYHNLSIHFQFNAQQNVDFAMTMKNVAVGAAFLYENNLTITPVYSMESKSMQTSSENRPIPSLLTLAPTKRNCLVPPQSFNAEKRYLNDLNKVSSSNRCAEAPVKRTTPIDGNFRRPRQIFTMQQEYELADYVRETSNYYSGLSSKEVRILAFVYGICNQVEMPTGWHESHQASFDWIVGFIKRTKLPSTMITGISFKGSTKQAKHSQ